jgi:NAD(P)-dependent dehydrogenase (short-subunit alcohol dehydrogenase family)
VGLVDLIRRRSASAPGNGIGLSLARRLAEAEGARVVITATRWACFTLLVAARSQPDEA